VEVTGSGTKEISDFGGYRSTLPPRLLEGNVVDALLQGDVQEPGRIQTLWWRSFDGGTSYLGAGGIEADASAVLIKLASAAYTSDGGGVWIAWPDGSGASSRLLMVRKRPRKTQGDPTVMSSPDARRVTLPWLHLAGEVPLLTWMEETADGWHFRARCGEGPVADVGQGAVPLSPGSAKTFVGEFTATASHDGEVWLAWADARDGDADVYLARGRCRLR
jgi:hypothetical protein